MADCFEHGTEQELRSSGLLRSLALSKGCVMPQKNAVLSYPLLQPEITRSVATEGGRTVRGSPSVSRSRLYGII
jgi:hypothetical protein